MSVREAVESVVATLSARTPEVEVLVESARALAFEVDEAAVPDQQGKTKSAASAVRELRAVVVEMVQRGRADADSDSDWSAPVVDIGASAVRDAPKSKPGDARRRGRGGGRAAG